MVDSKITLNWFGDEISAEFKRVGDKALMKAGLDLQQESGDQAPIELGDLRGNAGIDDSELASKSEIQVGYSLPYALRQHEELDYNHPGGGNAKFLENPFRKNWRKYGDFINQAIDEVTG